MTSRASRFIAATVVSLLFGWHVSHDMMRKHLLGKSSYLASQGVWYDKYLASYGHPFAEMIGYAVFIAAALALYEGLAFLFRFGWKGSSNA